MLIVCSGPDTYHARKKARELVAAFREKHDPTGYSTEVLSDTDADEIIARLGSPSLFAQKRMIRCDGLLADQKIADVRKLVKRLETDADQTILLSVEEEPTSSKNEKEFSSIKFVQYPYPLLSGTKFVATVTSRAKELGVSEEIAFSIARNADGDMWIADSELQKYAANPNSVLIQQENVGGNVFDAAEAYISGRSGWRDRLNELDEPENANIVFLSQARTYARVKDGETKDVHPYAVRKLASLRATEGRAKEALLRAIRSFAASRQGVSASSEETVLF